MQIKSYQLVVFFVHYQLTQRTSINSEWMWLTLKYIKKKQQSETFI